MPSPRIEAAAAKSGLIRNALEMADRAHNGQTRNGSGGMAYIHHPVAVAELLAERGYGEEVLAAALLHDVVEDSEITVEELRERFGERVAELVDALSDDESLEPYLERKDEHRRRVSGAGTEALAIYAADKLTNVGTLRRAYADQGEAVAEEFKVPLELKIEVWEADLAMLRERAPELPFLDDLETELSRFRADRSAASPLRGT